MTKDAFQYFARMFEADRSMSERAWFEQFAMYEFDSEAGAKPWFPPLSEVWRHGETCPYDEQNAATASWPEAWTLLQKHYSEYVDAKQQRTTAATEDP